MALEIQEQQAISGWDVIKARTDRDGLSCQAVRCDQPNCNRRSNASLLLWGSENRNAITPQVGLGAGLPKGFTAELEVAGQSFDFIQNKPPGPNRLVPKNESDDAKIVQAISNAAAQNAKSTVSVKSELGSFQIPIKAAPKVLRFFKSRCGIQ
ncbi:hypothetical protein [Ruegeria atlantica]|uniref:hypothetical protein n=1 Tax=Ruegeria atlantica TaxID=81569 RepID=UPI00147DA5E9|nr:hypothetical protein [Ruegeria atlantica]